MERGLVGFWPDDSVAISPGASEDGCIKNKMDDLYLLEDDHMFTIDVSPVTSNTVDNQSKGRLENNVEQKLWKKVLLAFTLVSIILIFTGLGIGIYHSHGCTNTLLTTLVPLLTLTPTTMLLTLIM